MRDINILSTACGAFFMPGFFRCLKSNNERKITIIGADLSDDSLQMELLVDKYYKVPPYSDPLYINAILNICKDENVDVFFPQISMELPYVLKRINEFENLGVKVAITNRATLDIANNKYRLYEFMRDHNLSTPPYFLVDSVETLKRRVSELGFPENPVVVKMAENSGSRGVRILKSNISKGDAFLKEKPSSMTISINDMCDILCECRPMPEIMAMKFLPGVEYTVDLLADRGKTLYIVGRRNTSSSLSIAQSSVVEKNEIAYKLCETLVAELELDGNIGFDFMMDENDMPWLTDLNPRVTATIILYLGAGINLPYLRVKQLLGEELPNVEPTYGVKIVRKYLDILYDEYGIIKI